LINQNEISGAPSPDVRNTLIKVVKTIMNSNGLSPLKITVNEILLIAIIVNVTKINRKNTAKLFARKTPTIKRIAIIILVLGSNL
jgi:hypothetical protein